MDVCKAVRGSGEFLEFRTVVILRDAQDMSYDEIGEILEIPRGTVKSRLHRARRILKEKFSDLVKVK